MHEHQVARAASSARAIALTCLELHVRSKMCHSTIQSFLLLKHTKCLILDKTGLSRVMNAKNVTSVAVATAKFLFGMC